MISKEKFHELSDRTGQRSPGHDSGMWLDRYFIREVSPSIAYYLAHKNVSANAVTLGFFALGLLADLLLAIPVWWTPVATFGLYIVVRIFDHVDGRLARFHKTQSKFGEALDNFAELLIHGVFFITLGIRLYLETGSAWPLLLGGIGGISYLYEGLWVRLSEELVGSFEPSRPTTFWSRVRTIYVNYDYILTTALVVAVLHALQTWSMISNLLLAFFVFHVILSFFVKVVLRFVFVFRKAQKAQMNEFRQKNTKIHSLPQVVEIIQNIRKGKRIVYFSGVFDLFHFGHFKALKSAGTLGDVLVVQINGDELTRKRKGSDRPYLGENFRAEMISAFGFVDYIFISNDYYSAPKTLEILRPDVMVSAKRVTESDVFRAEREAEWKKVVPKVQVVWLEETPEISTSMIIPVVAKNGKNLDSILKPTVSVGISAYNEEGNLGQLLNLISEQKEPSFSLHEIIVVSDGSTDSTAQIGRSFPDPRIKFIEFPRRLGKNAAQNTICQESSADFLVMLDADSLPLNRDYLTEMVNPLLDNPNVGIGGSEILPMPALTRLEKVISYGDNLKREIFRRWKDGQNVFECHGRSRIFSKKFYKKIIWPDDCVEDAYSYLFAAANTIPFLFISRTAVYFREPQTLRDYFRQSSRFLQSGVVLKKYLGTDFVRQEYKLPKSLVIKTVFRELLRHPLLTLGYLGVHFLSQIVAKFKVFDQSLIEPSKTSKKLTTHASFNN